MPNVRHEESLEGIAIPEFVQALALPSPAHQAEEEDAAQKSDSCTSRSQYREDQ